MMSEIGDFIRAVGTEGEGWVVLHQSTDGHNLELYFFANNIALDRNRTKLDRGYEVCQTLK